ncbi:hypothetical protein F4782DRAFT_510903 [Xylaria castorea]|nr:hypothetical protein F4782DRAFT_510903 [Xylaria castorea]
MCSPPVSRSFLPLSTLFACLSTMPSHQPFLFAVFRYSVDFTVNCSLYFLFNLYLSCNNSVRRCSGAFSLLDFSL